MATDDTDVDMTAPSAAPAPTEAPAPAHNKADEEAHRLFLSTVAAGKLDRLPVRGKIDDDTETEFELETPFLPLLTRLQNARRDAAPSASTVQPTEIDVVLQRCPDASALREYACVFARLTPTDVENFTTELAHEHADANDAAALKRSTSSTVYRRFESGSRRERACLVLRELLRAHKQTPVDMELFGNVIYQDEVAAILVHTVSSSAFQQPTQSALAFARSAVVRLCLHVPLGAVLLERLAVNDPSSVQELLDVTVAFLVEFTATTPSITKKKPMAQQEQEALTASASTVNALQRVTQACVTLAKLSPLYAIQMCERLSAQTTSLHCTAVAMAVLMDVFPTSDACVFLYQWLKCSGALGGALSTYIQLGSRSDASDASSFQRTATHHLTTLRATLLDALEQTTARCVSPHELTTTLDVCAGLQVLGGFPLGDQDRMRLLHSLETLTKTTSKASPRAVSLAFLVVVLLWYPLAPALSKAPGQRDEAIKSAVTLSQQLLFSLFHVRGAGPLFVVSAVLFYTKAPALVPFLASVMGLDGGLNTSTSASRGGMVTGGVRVQQALRAEYLHVFGDVVLKPILTESLLAHEVLAFPPAAQVSALDATSSGHTQHELTLRGLHGLLCEKSFLRHHHGHRLEAWLSVQVGEQAALPVHPLLVSLLLEWIENYVMAFEYPVAQAPRRLQLSIVPLRSSTLAKWLSAPCLSRPFRCRQSAEDELNWARAILGLTYALQFNQRLRHATMVAGSKLSSLVATKLVASSAASATAAAALGPGGDIWLHYELHAFPLRNMLTQVLTHGDQGGAFEYVAPTLLRLMTEEHPQLFDAAVASAGSSLALLPLASRPIDEEEEALQSCWFRRRRQGALPCITLQSPASRVSWTAAKMHVLELQNAPMTVIARELPVLVDDLLPFAVLSSSSTWNSTLDVASFCAQLTTLYETRARRERGASTALQMRIMHALCFPDVLWRQQQQMQKQMRRLSSGRPTLQLLTYDQVLEKPSLLIDDAHEGVFRQPSLLQLLMGVVRDVRAAASVHLTKCDPSLVPLDSIAAAASTTAAKAANVLQHRVLADCLLLHALLKRLSVLQQSDDDASLEESRSLLCGQMNELLAEDTSSPPRLLVLLHAQGYDDALVPVLLPRVPAMKRLWVYWMTPSSSSRATKVLLDFVGEGAEKDLPKWRFRLRVVLALCSRYFEAGTRQSAAMQQALRVVWNKLRNGVSNSSSESGGAYVALLSEVLPWVVDACGQHAELSAELVHFLLKLQKQQSSNSSSGSNKSSETRRTAGEVKDKPQVQREQLECVLQDAYASLLEQL